MRHHDDVHIAITPEGTRSLNKQWKKGFYFIALKCGIPIQLYALDYVNKTIVCTQQIIPTGNLEKDFAKINQYYSQFAERAKFPHKFSVNETL